MRNNTKLKSLLHDNNISLSMISPDADIEMIVTNINQHISFVVNGKNWSDVLNKALKHAGEIKKVHTPTSQVYEHNARAHK